MENTEYYKLMVEKQREYGVSLRAFAKKAGVGYAMIIEFFDTTKPFRILSKRSMALFNKNLGIPYKVMEDYNFELYKERNK